MNSIKKAPHPSGRNIIFEEERHIYYIEDDPKFKFVSGTTFLHKFVNPFDRENISKKYAAKNNLNQADVLKQWDDKARTSRENGTEVHAALENLFLGKSVVIPKSDDKVSKMKRIGIQLFNKLQSDYILLESEKIVADLNYKIAGMIDLLAAKQDGTICIMDYKTNEKITYENIWQTLKPPVSHLQDTSFNQYSLQLNIYQYIMTNQNYFAPDTKFERYLLHITPDKYDIIEVPDRQNEVINMIGACL